MKKDYILMTSKQVWVLMFLMSTFGLFGQTTFSWRSEATNGNWNDSNNWWNGFSNSTANFGILYFNNSNQPTMNNNFGGTFNTHALRFDNNSIRTVGGNTVRLYDNGGADPYIRNNSTGTHVLNFNLEGDGDGGDPLLIQINSTGGFTFGGTINNRGSNINLEGSRSGTGSNVTFNGVISGSGGLFKANPNIVVVFNASNTFTGTTTIEAGTLQLGQAGASFGSATSGVRIGSAGILNLNGFNATVRFISERAGFDGGVVNLGSGTLTIQDNESGTRFQNSINGTGNLIYDSSSGSVLSLYNNQGWSGSTTVRGGTLTSEGAMQTSSILVEGGAFRVTDSANRLAANPTVNITGGEFNPRTNETISSLTGSGGTVTLNTGNTLTINNEASNAYAGAIGGAGSLSKSGAGSLTLSGSLTYSGSTNVSGGSLVIPKAGYTATISATGVSVVFDPAPAVGTYPILPGALTSSATLTTTGLTSGRVATFNATNGILTVSDVPSVTLESSDVDNIICAGDSVTFTATASNTGEGTVTYDFKIDDNSVQSGSSEIFTTDELTNGQTVSVTINIAGGFVNPASVDSNSISMIVNTPALWYADSDGDGFGNPDDSIESCDQPDGYVDNNLDCDDSDDTITTAQIWYFDNDEDGFGDDSITLTDCFQPFGYVAQGGDCNDNDATIYPGATEICYDGILQNCDGELTDGCPAVTTTFWPTVCDEVLPFINTSIRAYTTFINQLPSGVSVTGYNFRITNLATSAVREVEKSTAMIRITETDIANFGTDYFVEVSIRLNAEWQPYGPGCIISTPALPTTSLNATSCNQVLPLIQSRVYATTVTGATGYLFEVSRMSGATAVQTLSIETTGNSFRLTDVPGLVMLYDTEYQVRIQVRSLVEGSEVYSSFGSVCSVFTPDAPEAAMIGCDLEVGLAPSTLNTLNYATALAEATQYRFTLTDGVYNQVLTTPTRGFRLSQFNALSPLTAGATYTVFVEVQLYGVFYAGKDCTITVPGGSILIRALEEGTEAITTTFDGFKAIASPNPFQGSFNLNVYTNSTQPVGVAIYDMTGRLLETREVGVDVLSGQLFGERYPSGVYNIVVTQDEEMHTVRVIKK